MQRLQLGQEGRQGAGLGHVGVRPEAQRTAQVVSLHTGVVRHSERPGVGVPLRAGVGAVSADWGGGVSVDWGGQSLRTGVEVSL